MSLVFNSGWESNDWSEWDSSPTGTRHQVNGSAGILGSYGDEITPSNSGSGTNWNISGFATTEQVLHFGFRININDLAATSPGAFTEVSMITLSSATLGVPLYVFLKDTGSGLFLSFVADDDSSSTTYNSAVIGAGNHTIEAVITRAATSGSSDGIFQVYIDNSLVHTTSSIDNYDLFNDINAGYITLLSADLPGGSSGSLYLDDVTLRDDATFLFTIGYDFIPSSGGLARYGIATSADGAYVFVALEENTSGNQYVFSSTRPVTGETPTVAAVYNPGGGSAAGVIAVPGNPDKMLFFGNFGTDVGVIMHTISTGANTDISPSSIGSDVIIWAAVDPSDEDHIVIINDTDNDLFETTDGGSNWTALDSSLPVTTVTGAAWIWSGAYFPDRGLIGGDDGSDEHLAYTPNEAANWREDTGANGLKTSDGIVGIDAVVS